MNKVAVIVAGGSGLRMGTFIPKQFLLIKGKPLLQYTLEAFLNAYDDMHIVLVLPEEHIERGEAIVETLTANYRITITQGGATRYQSVQNGLRLVNDEAVVFVHDGVRCLVDTSLIQRCFEQTLIKGSAIPAVTATESIRINLGNELTAVADRTKVCIMQTPQTFKSSIIKPAFEQLYKETFTDEATVVEAFGTPIFLVDGNYNNIKVTRPVDLAIAEKILEER